VRRVNANQSHRERHIVRAYFALDKVEGAQRDLLGIFYFRPSRGAQAQCELAGFDRREYLDTHSARDQPDKERSNGQINGHQGPTKTGQAVSKGGITRLETGKTPSG